MSSRSATKSLAYSMMSMSLGSLPNGDSRISATYLGGGGDSKVVVVHAHECS